MSFRISRAIVSCTLVRARVDTIPKIRASWLSRKSCTPHAFSAADRRGVVNRGTTRCGLLAFGLGLAARHKRTRIAFPDPLK